MEIRRYEENINRSKNEISRLVNSKNDRLLRFGDYMPKLVGEIIQMYNSRKFREQPKGPLGMFLNPKDKRWSLAIEQCLGGHLTAFVCGNYEDERTLQGLLAKYVPQVGQRPRIIVSKYDTPLYDTSRNVINSKCSISFKFSNSIHQRDPRRPVIQQCTRCSKSTTR